MSRAMRGKKSRPNVEQAGLTLKDWEFIQETVLSHDEDMIADFMDDIDTLLVFAGLFSAVLTAFLIVSIVLLAPDSSQLSVQLLSLIALQNGVSPTVRPFLNATADSLPTSIVFETSTTAVTINTLWFTSLVLSLAAALFGILAKQWCREYLRWHSVISTARENVLLRQLRYEAWESWKVASYIACIPALLEVALILFLTGLMVFVHTFAQRALSVIVSFVISSTLLGVFVLTILPVFYRLCPFQTPTGWAFVQLARSPVPLLLTLRLIEGLNRCRKSLGHRRQALVTLSQRLLASVSERRRDWRDYDLSVATNPRRCQIATPGLEKAGMCMGIREGFDIAAVDAFQTGVLIRALSWVQHGSTDQKIFGAVSECLHSLRKHDRTDQPGGSLPKSFFLSTMYAFCKADLCDLLDMMRSAFYLSLESTITLNTETPIDVEARVGPFVDVSQLRLHQRFVAVRDAWEDDPFTLELCHALAHSQILSLVDELVAVVDSNLVNLVEKQRIAEKITLLLSMLRCVRSQGVSRVATSTPGSMAGSFARTLEEAYTKLASHRAAYSMGLMSVFVELGRMLAPVTFEVKEGAHIMTINDSMPRAPTDWQSTDDGRYVSTWATLALQIYRTTEDFKDADRTHLFVNSVVPVFEVMRARIAAGLPVHEPPRWVDLPMSPAEPGSVSLRAWTLKSEPTAPLTELLSAMVHALEWSSEHRQSDCGAHVQLPWIKTMMRCFEVAGPWDTPYHDTILPHAIPLTEEPEMWPLFRRILRLIKACLARSLITEENAHSDLAVLLRFTRDAESLLRTRHPCPRPASIRSDVSPPATPCARPSRLPLQTSDIHAPERAGLSHEGSPISTCDTTDAEECTNSLGLDLLPLHVDISTLDDNKYLTTDSRLNPTSPDAAASQDNVSQEHQYTVRNVVTPLP